MVLETRAEGSRIMKVNYTIISIQLVLMTFIYRDFARDRNKRTTRVVGSQK